MNDLHVFVGILVVHKGLQQDLGRSAGMSDHYPVAGLYMANRLMSTDDPGFVDLTPVFHRILLFLRV
jgi:hypothetical protein